MMVKVFVSRGLTKTFGDTFKLREHPKASHHQAQFHGNMCVAELIALGMVTV